MSLSSYIMSKELGPDLVAIPVFLSRVFRHSSIYINTSVGIRPASDLRGKKIGVPEYQMTAALWIRGILQDEYGVRPQEVEWFNGGLDEPGRVEKLKLNLPTEIRLSSIPADKTLNNMLVAGELDAIITARAPSAFLKQTPAVARLFKDYKSEEIAYWRKTKIFPPMHCVAMRRDVYERNRWIAQSLYKAFVEAKKYCARSPICSTATYATRYRFCTLPSTSTARSSAMSTRGPMALSRQPPHPRCRRTLFARAWSDLAPLHDRGAVRPRSLDD